jgi:hypothetical protein
MIRSFVLASLCALVAAAIGHPLIAADSVRPGKVARIEKNAAPKNVVELFAAIDSEAIEVKVFAKDATGGTITVKNNTDKPLTIKAPAAFAAVPVLAQPCMGGMPCGGGVGGGGGGNQGMGGGMMGGMGGMGGMMGGMGGMFNVAPEKVAKIKFVAVCLDHGLKDPSPHVEYKLVPIDSYAKDPAVAEVIKLLVKGKVDQHSAQAAAWHLQNGLSWKELAQKVGAKHLDGSVEPYFTPMHLQRALNATRFAKDLAEKSLAQAQQTSPGETSAP